MPAAPDAYLAYTSMRCHTPSAGSGLCTLGYRFRLSPGNSVSTTSCRGEPIPCIMIYIGPWPLWANRKAILLTPDVLASCHGLLGFHQKPTYSSLPRKWSYKSVPGAPPVGNTFGKYALHPPGSDAGR